jgi:hypothetical protein
MGERYKWSMVFSIMLFEVIKNYYICNVLERSRKGKDIRNGKGGEFTSFCFLLTT